MKENKKILKRKERGITLIALVITIIVLLILAGVSIAMLTGDNGILTQAQNTKEQTEKTSELEGIQLAVMGCSITNNGYADILDTDSFTSELTKQFGKDGYQLVANGDGSFIVTVNNRKYYVNDDKTVIDSDNVIEIATEDELKKFRDEVNSGNSYEGKVVLLTNDITLSGEWEPIGFIASDTDSKNPETENNKPFQGIFDGGNHTINNLKISSNDNKYNGLFSFVVDGTIRNVTIGTKGENSEVTGNTGAGVVGYLYGFKGNISNCVNYANTNGAGIARTIAGEHTIFSCKNYGNINGYGGIVGSSNGTDWEQFTNVSNKIINCGNYGNVIRETGNYCGGIVGYFKGDVLNCCNKGEISSNHAYTGGISGSIAGKIQNCYNTSNINGQEITGGISGDQTEGNSINCYSLGEVCGTGTSIGNIVGWEYEKIINCYTKNHTFTAEDLGDAFVDDAENENGGYPMLKWE